MQNEKTTLKNCGSEDNEFNRKWHLVSANRVSWTGKPYAREGEALITANVGAWYETACYWREEAERLKKVGHEYQDMINKLTEQVWGLEKQVELVLAERNKALLAEAKYHSALNYMTKERDKFSEEFPQVYLAIQRRGIKL
jgi:hypothetical protein